MKLKIEILVLLLVLGLVGLTSCKEGSASAETETTTADAPGQSAVMDEESQKNVVGIAASSADHSTLVAGVKAGELVDALSNAGPFTVFAPTNAAFDKLPKGTLDDLLKPENKEKLVEILQYHVYVGVIKPEMVRDGMSLNQVYGGNVKLGKNGDKITVNGANVLGTIPASNGIIYSIDAVLLPSGK